MKITIDTSIIPHRIEIKGDCTLGELTDFLSKFYPDFTWRDIRISGKGYTINIPATQPWTNPNPWITGPITIPVPYVGDPIGPGTITYCSDTNTVTNEKTGKSINLNDWANWGK